MDDQVHVEFQVEDVASELTKDEVIAKLRLSGGAHQPTSYEVRRSRRSSTAGSHRRG